MTHRRKCSVGFFLPFKIICKLSAYWGLDPIQGLFCQSSIWVLGLQNSLFLWMDLISFQFFPCWLAVLPPTADWYDSRAGPYHCCLWSSVCLLSKCVVLRYYQDSLTGPFSVLCTHVQYECFCNCQRGDGALRFMTLPEPFRMNYGLSSTLRVTFSL